MTRAILKIQSSFARIRYRAIKLISDIVTCAAKDIAILILNPMSVMLIGKTWTHLTVLIAHSYSPSTSPVSSFLCMAMLSMTLCSIDLVSSISFKSLFLPYIYKWIRLLFIDADSGKLFKMSAVWLFVTLCKCLWLLVANY